MPVMVYLSTFSTVSNNTTLARRLASAEPELSSAEHVVWHIRLILVSILHFMTRNNHADLGRRTQISYFMTNYSLGVRAYVCVCLYVVYAITFQL